MTAAKTSTGAVAATVIICVLATQLAACATHGTRMRPGANGCGVGTFSAPFTSVDSCSATAVLVAAATAVFSARPSEQDQRSAFQSAAGLIEPAYLRRLGDSGVALWPVTGATWARWAAAGVRVDAVARVSAEDHPADTADAVSRVIAVTEQPSDGEPSARFAAHMRAARTELGAPWLVDMIEVPS